MTARRPPFDRPSTAPAMRIPRWLSFDRTGRAHAYIGRANTAVCGARREPDRYQWPRRWRCPDCERLLAEPAR